MDFHGKEDTFVNVEDIAGQRGAMLTFAEVSQLILDTKSVADMRGYLRVFVQPSAAAYLDLANAADKVVPCLGAYTVGFQIADKTAIHFWEEEVERMPGAYGSGHTAITAHITLRANLMERVTKWCSGALAEMAKTDPEKVRCVFVFETAMTQVPSVRDVEPDQPVPNAHNVSYPFGQLTVFFVESNRLDGSQARLRFPPFKFAIQ